MKKKPGRFVWTPNNVASRDMARTVIRTAIEHAQTRQMLWDMPSGLAKDLDAVCEVGAGFGRMTHMLAEDYANVVAFEREPHLIATLQRLVPKAKAVQVASLTKLPADDGSYALVLSFTVLQHMSDDEATAVLAEMARISSWLVLVVEDTDPDHHYLDGKEKTHFTHGRTSKWYGEHLPGFELKHSEPRRVEPGFTYKGQPRPTVGEYMLFEKVPS
jgi:ubiquinone/menaquinone biosynthesis C-methylase UbiE